MPRPRAACPLCGISHALNNDGRMRDHFCPHRQPCRPDHCLACTLEAEPPLETSSDEMKDEPCVRCNRNVFHGEAHRSDCPVQKAE
jgi:hypothetical protein